jgi:ankyrin repeat protein
MKELLRKENKHKETALHEAVRAGNKDIVNLLMGKDSELASFSSRWRRITYVPSHRARTAVKL